MHIGKDAAHPCQHVTVNEKLVANRSSHLDRLTCRDTLCSSQFCREAKIRRHPFRMTARPAVQPSAVPPTLGTPAWRLVWQHCAAVHARSWTDPGRDCARSHARKHLVPRESLAAPAQDTARTAHPDRSIRSSTFRHPAGTDGLRPRRHAHRFSCALRGEARRYLARTRVRCCAGLSVPPARSSWICQSSSRSARKVGPVLCAQRGDVLDVDGTEIIDHPYIECREALSSLGLNRARIKVPPYSLHVNGPMQH